MTLRMADAIYPQNLPGGMDAYAGYDDGNWPDYQAIAAAHPGTHLLDLTVWLANRGQGLDVEPGDATVAQSVPYVQERLAAGVWRPVIYASISLMGQVANALTAAGIARSSYRLLSAHYAGYAHICGPGTCKLGPQCDGTQWIDHGGWDESILADDFFSTSPTSTPASSPTAPTPAPPPPAPLPTTGEVKMGSFCVSYWPADGWYHGWAIHPDGTVWQYIDPDINKVHAAAGATSGFGTNGICLQGELHAGSAKEIVASEFSPDGKRSWQVVSVVGQDDFLYEQIWTPANGWSGWVRQGGPLLPPPVGPAGPAGPASTVPGPAGPPGDPGPASTVPGPAGPSYDDTAIKAAIADLQAKVSAVAADLGKS